MRASIVRSFGDPPSTALDRLFDAAADLNIENLRIGREHGKTLITGVAQYQLDRELFFDAVKHLDGWESDVVLEIAVERDDVRGYHTVKRGETLASIAERHLGSANRDMEIFELNRDRMNDPDQILPGQQVVVPWRERRTTKHE
jgi:nucleoid-associated protein YgaU